MEDDATESSLFGVISLAICFRIAWGRDFRSRRKEMDCCDSVKPACHRIVWKYNTEGEVGDGEMCDFKRKLLLSKTSRWAAMVVDEGGEIQFKFFDVKKETSSHLNKNQTTRRKMFPLIQIFLPMVITIRMLMLMLKDANYGNPATTTITTTTTME